MAIDSAAVDGCGRSGTHSGVQWIGTSEDQRPIPCSPSAGRRKRSIAGNGSKSAVVIENRGPRQILQHFERCEQYSSNLGCNGAEENGILR